MNTETRPLSFFLQKRAEENHLQEKIQQRKARIEKKKKEEKKRRETLYEKERRSSFQKTKNHIQRTRVFLDHTKKNLLLAKKSIDETMKEFKTEKEEGLFIDILRQVETLQRQMNTRLNELESLEEKDLRANRS